MGTERGAHLGCYALLVLMGLVAWSNAPWGEYCYDDVSVIVECPAIGSVRNLSDLFTKNYSPSFRELSYRPVVSLSYFVDAILFGRRAPLSRLLNLALHIGAAMLLYGLWWHLFGTRRVAFFAAALFLVHPITTEVVNSPGFREEILCLVFMVAAMHALMHALGELDGRPSKRWAWLAGALWLLGLLSKEPAVMLPVLFTMALMRSSAWGGVARLAFRVHRGTIFWGVIPLVIVFAVYVSLYVSLGDVGMAGEEADRVSSAVQDWPGERGFPLRFLNFTRSFLLYGRLWLVPTGLSVNHWFRPSDSLSDWRLYVGLAGFLVFAGLCAAAWFGRSESRGFGAAWALVMLAPLAQVLPTPELVAERYAYLPHVGVSLLVASLVIGLGRSRNAKRGASAVLAVVLAVLMVLTWQRNRDWRDDTTLNIAAYEKWHNAEGYLALGALYYGKRDLGRAHAYFSESLRLNPHNPDTHRNVGLIALEMGALDRARFYLEASRRLKPGDARTRQALEILEKMELERAGVATSGTLRAAPQSPGSPSSAP